VVDVWNVYTRGYHNLAATLDNAVVIEYEHLLLKPEAVVRRIAFLLSADLRGPVKVMAKPAKVHGLPTGRCAAMEKLEGMSYLRSECFRKRNQSRAAVCKRLDKEMLNVFDVPLTPPRKYASDCRHTLL